MKLFLFSAVILSCGAAFPASAQNAEYKVIKTIKVPDGGWDYGSSDLDRNVVYFVRTDHTDVIDAKTGKLSILKNTAEGHLAVPFPGTSVVVIPLRKPENLTRVFDVDSDKVLADIPSGVGPDSDVYDPSTKHVFVVNHRGSDLTEIDATEKKAVSTIKIGAGRLEFPAVDGKGHLFVGEQDESSIAVADLTAKKLSATYKLTKCEDLGGLSYAPHSDLIFAPCGDGTIRAVDASTGVEVKSIPICKGTDQTIYDPKRDVIFAPCGDDGMLAVISASDRKDIGVLQKLDTMPMARSGAVDADGNVYLMGAEMDTSKPRGAGNRYPAKADTMTVVVVGR